jgi:ketosteroid isomerase-like protein
MKLIIFAIILTFVMTGSVSGQSMNQNNALEQKIRKLEQAQVDALLRNDIAAMKKNWATDYVVNNPMNEVIEASKGRIQAGTRTYSSFIRAIERVLVHGNTVIVMGQETVVPSGNAPDAGKTIIRRFTNIWMKRDGKWLLTARQATVICPQ